MSFTLDMKKAVKNIKEDTEKVVRGTLFGISSRIIKATPVGNPALWQSPAPEGYVGGSLRGAWSATIGAPDNIPKKSIDSNGSKTVNDMATTANNVNIGQSFYLSNSLPYAVRVEFGHSTQAPNGMVRRAVAQTQQIVDKAAR